MKYNFDEVINRRNTDCIKWDFMEAMDPRVSKTALPLWVADMEFKVADEILDAMHKRVDEGIFGYTKAGENYYEAVIGWYNKRFNWEIKKDSIYYAPGIVPALGFIIDALTDLNDGIIIQQPVYYPFANTIKGNSRTIVSNDLINNDGYYTIDFEDLREKAKDPKNKMMIFCTPHNPVGRVWNKEEILEVVKICKDTGTILIADEIHCDLVRKDVTQYPLLSLVDDTSNIIVTLAPSKTFNLAGMQMSVVVIEDKVLADKYYDSMNTKFAIGNYPSLGLTAATAAYAHGEDWLNQVNDYLDANIDFVAEYVKNNMPKAKYNKPEGTYLVWLDLSAYGNTNEIQDKLILEQDLLIENGNIFGDSGQGYFRINVACSQSQLEDCLSRIVNVIK